MAPQFIEFSMGKQLFSNEFGKCNFYGKSAHAAANPEAANSALKAVQLMDIGVNFLREHLIDPIRIHSTITNGGGAPNETSKRTD